MKITYAQAIRSAFQYLLKTYPNVFVMGQGLWSPWYVGNSMNDLEVEFGKDRVMDTPVSEAACTGAGIGASLCGYRPIVVHPRMDFMILAMDQIVNQAAKWSHMLGGETHPAVTIRGVINRGGEQGAQHSQALHAWFAHIPGLRVVMPATVLDARDLLISAVLSDDPVIYIDDRWLYELEDDLPEIEEKDLSLQLPKILRNGQDATLAASGYSVQLCLEAAQALSEEGIQCEVVDLRVLNPLNVTSIIDSVSKTGSLCVVDGGWESCGMAGEVIASVAVQMSQSSKNIQYKRITLPNAPAPSSKVLEDIYYPTRETIVQVIKEWNI
ncbi:MAG: pyruvate dehydrogenase [Nitrospinae bacterium CG11_big_fil_rev_8_21_14_0_20_45_15]|nr:MAG: pyruvate dehydrogenase [Nitrospinae bacterium CG11_big_fil_rev_8_21_14_0_20_45_15]